jgi:Uma2 family endonuclease
MGALPKTSMAVPEFLSWWEKQSDDVRYELVDGIVYAMGRDKIGHNIAKLRAVNALQNAITLAGLDCIAFTDGVGISPDAKNYRLPDASVNCGPVSDDSTLLPNPVIVVEVVSPSSEERDVHSKLRDYFAIKSVCHYLIIYPERKFVVHHHRQNSEEPVVTTFVTSGVLDLIPPGLSIAASDLLNKWSAQ